MDYCNIYSDIDVVSTCCCKWRVEHEGKSGDLLVNLCPNPHDQFPQYKHGTMMDGWVGDTAIDSRSKKNITHILGFSIY